MTTDKIEEGKADARALLADWRAAGGTAWLVRNNRGELEPKLIAPRHIMHQFEERLLQHTRAYPVTLVRILAQEEVDQRDRERADKLANMRAKGLDKSA